MGVTAQDQQSRAPYEDGKWYWVEKESWVGQPPTVAPACYRADCDAWYSYVFSGITTRYLKVLEPCERQAPRALPAGMGHLPACPFPCGWDGLHKIAVADGAYLARIDWPEDEEGVSVQRAAAMRTVTNLIDVCRAILAATPKAPTP